MFMCTSCGGEQENGDFCMHCGASLSSNRPEASRSADASSAGGTTEDTVLKRFTTSMKIKPETPPPHPRLWAVIGLLAVVGGLLVVVSIYLLFNALPLLGDGGFGSALGLFIILLLIVPLVFGCGLLYLARRLQQGDRLSRVLTVVTCAAVALASLLSGARDAGWVLAAILALGVILLLTIDPVVRAHFSGPDARYGSEPTPVVAARGLMVVVAACDVFVALGFFVLSPYAGSLAVWGVVILTVGISVFVLSRQLAAGSTTARVLTTGLAAVYLVLSLFAGHGEPGVILPATFALCIPCLLWLPSSSREYFAGLDRPTAPLILAVEHTLNSVSSSLVGTFQDDGPPTTKP
jgi:hypothetical protein